MWVLGTGHQPQVGSAVVQQGGEASGGNGGAQEALGQVRGGTEEVREVVDNLLLLSVLKWW